MAFTHLLRLHKYWYIIGLLALDAIFFSTTNPGKVPIQLLIVGYTLVISSFYVLARLFSRFLGVYGDGVRQAGYRIARVLTAMLAILLAMQSVGQLSPKDVAALIPLVAVSYMYMTYVRRHSPEPAIEHL